MTNDPPLIQGAYSAHHLEMMNRIVIRPDGTNDRLGNLTPAEIRAWVMGPLETLAADAEEMLNALPHDPDD